MNLPRTGDMKATKLPKLSVGRGVSPLVLGTKDPKALLSLAPSKDVRRTRRAQGRLQAQASTERFWMVLSSRSCWSAAAPANHGTFRAGSTATIRHRPVTRVG